jgi:hypothetical protein
LWLLHRMDIFDKHRELLTLSRSLHVAIETKDGDPVRARSVDLVEWPVDERTPLATVVVADSQVKVYVKPTMEIFAAGITVYKESRKRFSYPLQVPLPGSLDGIHHAVVRAVTTLSRYLD